MHDRPTPKSVRQHSEDELAITWADGHESVYPVRLLRLACRCAQCVDEASGRKVLDPSRVPTDVRPVTITPTGRYGYNIAWTDGHATGIYTFEYLRELCPCCSEKRDGA